MATDRIILLVYIVLLLLGGVMGFVKGKSKASLIASTVFAVILFLFAWNYLPFDYHWIVLLFLILFFGSRYFKTRKAMPNGIFAVLSLIVLILTQLF